ncbi:hypothetical protein JCM10914A_38700 [Paenibacillus sp. JCM 10914]|uniref:hypothetical protein n=1 Tax=Paenibacillus sp. JCM 10914 TaxID=1236974 RepID=UPI0003CCA2AC|nr:hypothetical protein [Paenibacillus sp. JCM 10914]GAE04582.1 hypothetical protein JCM10914_633 [Paenibacillus sp. JCM 10914]
MTDRLESWNLRVQEICAQADVPDDAKTIIREMYEEISKLDKQNHSLRRNALRASSKDRMSSKLKDALME